ncbi:MAG: adenosine deaminase [bacterium]|nr:adenosine deaminase [bacterium]MDE0352740.1 adenosine deaminase [bacterium]
MSPEQSRPVSSPTFDRLRQAPKVVLHDHLDGGLRPSTIVELARETGYRGLPTHDPGELAALIQEGARRRSLELYLEMFRHTLGVMQTGRAVYRVAAECAQDLASDNVVYAEVRFAPELNTEGGLSLDRVVEAALAGFRDGSEGRGIRIGLLLCTMRTASRSLEIAELVLKYRDRGVAGFDIAGAEAGHPPSDHLPAFDLLRRAGMPYTIHAGEADGLDSIREAVRTCGARRIGHGIRILDDIGEDGAPGSLAAELRDRKMPLEQCPTSNVHIGAVPSITAHPIGRLLDLGFRVTVNTDNRLMSGVSLTGEFDRCCQAFGWSWPEVHRLTTNAMEGAFLPADQHREIISQVIDPWYATPPD